MVVVRGDMAIVTFDPPVFILIKNAHFNNTGSPPERTSSLSLTFYIYFQKFSRKT